MSPEDQRKALYQQEKARLEADEREKQERLDRGNNDPALRPPREFIESAQGPLRSQEEIARLAEQRADRQLHDAERERADREAFIKSAEAHNKRLEERQQDRTKDYWAKAQSPDKEQKQEMNRDYWSGKAKAEPERSDDRAPRREQDRDRDR